MRIGLFIAIGSIFTLFASPKIALAREKLIKYGDLPPAVQKTAQAETKGATVKGYSKEVAKGRVVYEVETVTDGKSRDISIDSSGTVIETEQQVSLDRVPTGARAAIGKAAERGSILKVEEVKSDSETAYEAQILSNGKHREVRVHADGSPAPEQD